MLKIKCNVTKLLDEFVAAGIKPYPVFDNEDGTGTFGFPEGTDMSAVQAIIDNHDPTPSPKLPTDKERLEALEAAMLEVILDNG